MLDALDVRGPVAAVTAGWQERETDDAELMSLLDGRGLNLRLHARWMDVLQAPGTSPGLMSGNNHLFANTPGTNTSHWLQVKLVGTVSNHDAVGARLGRSPAATW